MVQEVLIEMDKVTKIMSISCNGENIYYGYYSDFNSTPQGPKRFLSDIGIRTYLRDREFEEIDDEDEDETFN